MTVPLRGGRPIRRRRRRAHEAVTSTTDVRGPAASDAQRAGAAGRGIDETPPADNDDVRQRSRAAMCSGIGAARRAVAGLALLYAVFLATIAVARDEAERDRANAAAIRQLGAYHTVVSGARTATPTELSRLGLAWLEHRQTATSTPSAILRPALDSARVAAAGALVARVGVVLAMPGYVDPDERVWLSALRDSVGRDTLVDPAR